VEGLVGREVDIAEAIESNLLEREDEGLRDNVMVYN